MAQEDDGYRRRREALRKAGVEILELSGSGKVPLAQLMEELGRREIDGVLLEGGAELNYSALEAGIVRKVYAYVAPKLAGGKQAATPVGGEGIAKMAAAWRLENLSVCRLGEDIRLDGYLPDKERGAEDVYRDH